MSLILFGQAVHTIKLSGEQGHYRFTEVSVSHHCNLLFQKPDAVKGCVNAYLHAAWVQYELMAAFHISLPFTFHKSSHLANEFQSSVHLMAN